MKIIEPDVEMQLRLPWSAICRLAVIAATQNQTFNEICNVALREKLGRELNALRVKRRGRKKNG